MKTVRNDVRKIRAIAARLQRRRVGHLAFGIVIGILVAACSSGLNSPDPSANPPAASQGGAPGQAAPPSTQAALPPTAEVSLANTPAASQGSAPGQAAPAPTAEASLANPPAASQGSAPGQAALPGTEEFGLTREGLVTSIESVESLIAKCMRDAGFEYVAVDYNTVRRGMVADKSLPGLSEKEYVDQFGFGMSTMYTGRAPQLADATTPAKIGLGEQNVRTFNNLSPADQIAYNHTLLGDNTDATFAVSLEIEDFSRTGGCTRAAIGQVFTQEQLQATYRNPLDALIDQDPRMAAALTQYADCVRAAGFNYNHPFDVERDIKNRLDAITNGAPIEALSADASAALTQLQGEERAVAVVSYNCETRILDPVEDQIQRELFAAPVK